MIKIMIFPFTVLCLTIAAQGASTDNLKGHAENQKSADSLQQNQHYDYSEKPVFPPQDQITNLKEKKMIPSRSMIRLYVGYASTSRSNTDMNESFASMESSYGIHLGNSFDFVDKSFMIGARLQLHKNVGLMWEYLYGGKPGANQYTLSSTSMSIMVSLSPNTILSPSIGIGLATQKIKAWRNYYYHLNGDAILENIKFDSGPTWGVPLIALLEINPFRENKGVSFFGSMRIVFGPSPTVVQQLERATSESSVKIDMNNARFTAGISFAL